MVRVAIVGCGPLGVKIAGDFAYHGHQVKCYDNNENSLNRVHERYESDKAQLFADRLVESANFIGQVLCRSRLEETVSDAQIIIETMVDDFDLKLALLEKVSSLCPVDAIIATSTLDLDINKLAEHVRSKERLVGLRFLNPVYFIPEVEFTPHQDTANWTVEKLRTLLGRMGKTLFFRSGSEPLELTEKGQEMRKQQRIDDMFTRSGFPPIRARKNLKNEWHSLNRRRSTNQSMKNKNDSKISKLINFLYKSKKIQLDEEESQNCVTTGLDCVICMESKRDSVLMPCNHLISCFNCSVLMLKKTDKCPICREDVECAIKISTS